MEKLVSLHLSMNMFLKIDWDDILKWSFDEKKILSVSRTLCDIVLKKHNHHFVYISNSFAVKASNFWTCDGQIDNEVESSKNFGDFFSFKPKYV